MRTGGAPRSSGVRAGSAIACATLSALVVLPGIGRASLWWDECHSIVTAQAVGRLGVIDLLARLSKGLSPYFVLLAPVAGPGVPEWLVRLPSALAAIALVFVAWRIGGLLCGPPLGWRCALAVAAAPLVAWHAREARWYTLAWLLGGLALMYGIESLQRPGWRSPLLAAAAGFAAASVYAPAAAGTVVLLIVVLARRAGRSWPQRPPRPAVPAQERARMLALLAGAAVLSIAAFAWLLRTLVIPATQGGAGFGFRNLGGLSLPAIAYTPVAFATGYTIGPGPAEWHSRPPVPPAPIEAAMMLAGVVGIVLLAFRGVRIVRSVRNDRSAGLLLALVGIPFLAVVAGAAWTGHSYAPRHASMAWFPLVLLAAAGTLPGRGGGRGPLVAAGLLLGLQATALVNLHASPRYLREQVRPAAVELAREAGPGDLVLVFGGIDLPWRHYAAAGTAPSRIVYADDPATWNPGSVREMALGHERVFVVRGLILATPAEEPLLEAVSAVSRLVATRTFPGVTVETREVAPVPDVSR